MRDEVRWIVELPDVLEIPRLVGSVVQGHQQKKQCCLSRLIGAELQPLGSDSDSLWALASDNASRIKSSS